MGVFQTAAVAILVLPALTGVLALTENLRAGDLPRVRALCRCGLVRACCSTFINAVWSLLLTVLALPLGAVFAREQRPRQPAAQPPVLLVHGLYHNPSAWFAFRRQLKAGGFTSVLSYGYSSFGPHFSVIAAGLADEIRAAAKGSPSGRVQLVGHSLGGLVIRAACAEPGVCGLVEGVVTLGTPHQGSTLAGLLAVGRLGRGLEPGGEVLTTLEGLPECPVRALSLYTPTDGMVLPLSGALLTERQHMAGWKEEPVAPMSHVGLLYARDVAARAIEHLRHLRPVEG
jgi:triacylglycerol lipase